MLFKWLVLYPLTTIACLPTPLLYASNRVSVKVVDVFDAGLGSCDEYIHKPASMSETGAVIAADYIGFVTKVEKNGMVRRFADASLQDPFETVRVVAGPFSLGGDRAYFTTSKSQLFLLDLSEHSVSSIEVKLDAPSFGAGRYMKNENLLFIQDILQNLYLIDVETGEFLWKTSLLTEGYGSPLYGGYRTSFQPFPLTNKSAITLSSDGFIALIRLYNGSLVDRVQLFSIDRIYDVIEDNLSGNAAIQMNGGLIYIATTKGIVCLEGSGIDQNDRLNVTVIWRNNDEVWHDFIVDENFIYYTTISGELVALRKRNGHEEWRIDLDSSPEVLVGSPLLYNSPSGERVIIVPDSFGALHFVDPLSGRLIEKYAIPKPILYNLLGAECGLTSYVLEGEDGYLWVYDLSGRLLKMQCNISKDSREANINLPEEIQ